MSKGAWQPLPARRNQGNIFGCPTKNRLGELLATHRHPARLTIEDCSRIAISMEQDRSKKRTNVLEVRKAFSEARRNRLQRQLPMTLEKARRNQATMKSGN